MLKRNKVDIVTKKTCVIFFISVLTQIIKVNKKIIINVNNAGI